MEWFFIIGGILAIGALLVLSRWFCMQRDKLKENGKE